jgi:integrase/recombinase XerD
MIFNDYFDYLKKERKMSDNTVSAYKQDLLEFVNFEEGRGTQDLTQVQNTEVVAYLLNLKNGGKSAATVNRKLASIRAYYNYLMERQNIQFNPTGHIKSPKIERKALEYLTLQEVDNLLTIPDRTTRGIRDKAILELLYATGIRVSELIQANLEDINLRMGFITCTGEQSKARIIPLGRPARAAIEDYIYESRDKLLRDKREETALFVNYSGHRITRQGLWKILKEYGRKAGISKKLTPNIVRNSFAVHMIQNGADLKSLQELLGHVDISATQIYLSVTKNRIKDVYDKAHPRA